MRASTEGRVFRVILSSPSPVVISPPVMLLMTILSAPSEPITSPLVVTSLNIMLSTLLTSLRFTSSLMTLLK